MPERKQPDLTKLGKLERLAQFDLSTLDVEKRTVELAFSSEVEVSRWFGIEVLSHEAGACDLSRLNASAPLLFNHDFNRHLGVIESARIDADKKGRAVVRFGKSPAADEKFQDVQDGILVNVSVGYAIRDMKYDNPDDSKEDRYLITNWQPYEISMVTIPADDTVGVGRGLEPMPQDNSGGDASNLNPIQPVITHSNERTNMPQDNQNPVVAPVAAPTVNVTDNNQTRIQEMVAIGQQYNAPDLALRMIGEGKTPMDLQAALLERMKTPVTRTDGHIDMDNADLKRDYSFLRALNAQITGDWSRAGFEREINQTLAQQRKENARGFYVPTDLLMQRAYSVGVAANGGNVVANDFRSDLLVDWLRNHTVVGSLGVTVLTGLVGDITIPKVLSGNAVAWLDENGAPPESSATFGQVGLKPKTIAAHTQLSRKFIQQSSLSAEQFATNELLSAIALGVDVAVLQGTGANGQPLGILNVNGVGSVASGGTLNWANIVDLETSVAAANADNGSLAYLTNTKVRGKLKQTLKAADGHESFIWTGDNSLNGYPAHVSNQVTSKLGAATNESAIVFGNWADLLLAMWGVVDVNPDPYTKSDIGAVRITAFQDVDTQVRHAESFAVCKDIKA